MASSKEYLDFVLDQSSGLSARAMMGEYVLQYGGKVVGGIYDNRLLVKPTRSSVALMPEAPRELPYTSDTEYIYSEIEKFKSNTTVLCLEIEYMTGKIVNEA